MSLEYGRSRTPWAARVWAEAAGIRCFIRRWKRPSMRAIGLMRFGGPEVLQPIDIELPEPGPAEIRIRVNGLVDAANPQALVLGAMADGGGLAEVRGWAGPACGILPFTPSLQTQWPVTHQASRTGSRPCHIRQADPVRRGGTASGTSGRSSSPTRPRRLARPTRPGFHPVS